MIEPSKPLDEMTDEEIDQMAEELYDQMSKQVRAHRKATSKQRWSRPRRVSWSLPCPLARRSPAIFLVERKSLPKVKRSMCCKHPID